MKKFNLTYTLVGTEDFVTSYEVTLDGKKLDSFLYKKEFINKILDRAGNFSYDFYDTVLEIYVPSMNKKVFKWVGYKFHPEKGKDYFFKEIDEIVEVIKEIEEWQFEVTSITTTYKYVYKGEGK